MKRATDIVYISYTNDASLRRQSDLNFHLKSLPKLVDHSFHDDNDDEYDVGKRTNAVEELQNHLYSLLPPVYRRSETDSVTVSSRRKVVTESVQSLTEKASLKLQKEEEAEKARNERLMTHLTDALSDGERPEKKRKVDLSSTVTRLMARRCRLLQDRKSSGKSICALKNSFLKGLLKMCKR